MNDKQNIVTSLLEWKETSKSILEHSLKSPRDGSLAINVTNEETQETEQIPFQGDFAKGFEAATLISISLLDTFPLKLKTDEN